MICNLLADQHLFLFVEEKVESVVTNLWWVMLGVRTLQITSLKRIESASVIEDWPSESAKMACKDKLQITSLKGTESALTEETPGNSISYLPSSRTVTTTPRPVMFLPHTGITCRSNLGKLLDGLVSFCKTDKLV